MDTSWLEYQIPEIDIPCCAPLLAKMKDGDEFWTFTNPEKADGEAGIALVRNGLIVAHVVSFGN